MRCPIKKASIRRKNPCRFAGRESPFDVLMSQRNNSRARTSAGSRSISFSCTSSITSRSGCGAIGCPSRDEAALALAYDIGRSAVADGTSVLILTQIHHEILREVVAESPAEDADHLIERAAEFVAEVLASVEMVQRSLRAQ